MNSLSDRCAILVLVASVNCFPIILCVSPSQVPCTVVVDVIFRVNLAFTRTPWQTIASGMDSVQPSTSVLCRVLVIGAGSRCVGVAV